MWRRPAWFSLKGKVGVRCRKGDALLRHPASQLQPAGQPIRAPQPRRAATLEVPRPRSSRRTEAGNGAAPVHLLVDSTGLKLCGPGEWLIEKHGTKARRSWRKLHLGVDAN